MLWADDGPKCEYGFLGESDLAVEGGVADDEFGADDDGVGGAGGGDAGQVFEEAAGGLFAHFFAGIIDGGQFGLGDLRNSIIVEAYDGDIFGHAEATFFECLQEQGSEKIISGKDAVGAGLHVEDLAAAAESGGFAQVVDQQQVGVEGQAIVDQGLFVSFQPACIDVPAEVGGDVGDAAATLGCQVGGGFITCSYIIDNNAGPVREFFYAVEEDDGDPFLHIGVEVIHLFRVEGQGGDEPIHSFVEEVVGVGGFFPVGLGGVADDEIITGFGHYLFDAGEDGADELAFQFVDDNADSIGLLHPQVAGKAIGAVAHLFGGVHDPLARLYIDGGMVFQTSADGSG